MVIKETEDKAIIYVYGVIGDHWKESKANRAKDFASALDDFSPKALEIRVDSPGGDVFDGFSIASAIQRYDGETHVFIDGMAASAASYIAVMADKVTMNDFSAVMIHNASSVVWGNRDAMRETADLLERLDNNIASIIATRTGMKLEEVQDAMTAETWYFGEEAKNAGFCDEVVKTEKRGKATLDREFADHYKNVPDRIEIVEDVEEGIGATTANDQATKYMVTLNGSGLTIFPVESAPEQHIDASQIAAGALPEGDGGVTSHQVSIVPDNEVTAPAGAMLLGNRIYRKEQ